MEVGNYFGNVSKNYNKKRIGGFFGVLLNIFFVDKEKKVLISKLKPSRGEKILDAGCGSGLYSKIIASYGAEPFGIDISEGMIQQYTKSGMPGVVGDIEKLPFNFKFDKILCAGALEFANDPSLAISSFSEHLKKNGTFVLLYPKSNIFGLLYYLYHKSHRINIKLFSKKHITNIIGSNNFILISICGANPLTNVLVTKRI